MEFKILGPLEIVRGGERIPIPALKQRAVLAVLLIGVNKLIPVDQLVYELWGDDPPAQAKSVLQGYVSNLRRVLEPDRPARAPARVLASRASGYALVTDPDDVDSLRFEARAAEGHRLVAAGQAEAAQGALEAGLVLWRGPALADFAYEPFAQPEAARLEELRAVCLEDRVECDLALGRHAAAIAELETMVGQRPLRERLWAQLMVGLYRAGRQSEALRTYERARRVLRDELGIDPGPGLRRLEADILAQDGSLDRRHSMLDLSAEWPHPPGVARPAVARRPEKSLPMPHQLTVATGARPFVGRTEELARLRGLWEEASAGTRRVAVLGGEPGAGKTRLAVELARTALAEGAVVLAGRCDEDLGVPYQPFVQALRHLADHTPDNRRLGRHAVELVRLVPELTERLPPPPSPPPPAADAGTARGRLFDAVSAWLAAAGGGDPVLLVLDDLQWAAPETLLLVRHVVRSPGPMRLLVVAVHRDTDLGRSHPLTELLADLRREPATAERIRVVGLDVDDVAELLAVNSALAAAVHTATAGNPFLVGEMAGAGLQVSDGVREWVGRRLSRMSDETHETLVHAAAAGASVDCAGLIAATGSDEHAMLCALDEVTAAGLLVEVVDAPGRYRFRHPLVRDAICDALSPARRATLARRMTQAEP